MQDVLSYIVFFNLDCFNSEGTNLKRRFAWMVDKKMKEKIIWLNLW